MLQWLESTYIAHVVQETLWGYPVVLICHAVGMAVLAGIVLIINFRLLGLAQRIPLASLEPMFKIALVGLVINLISGVLLFVASASQFYESNPFRIKVLLLLVGGILLFRLPKRVFGPAGPAPSESVAYSTKWLAAFSSVVWLGVIVTGRLIAYVDTPTY